MLEIDSDNSPVAALRRVLALLIAALVMAFGIAARADSVRVYDQVGVEGAQVTIGDVAELTGPHARALNGVGLATLKDGRDELDVTADDIQRAMDLAGVNRGLVSLRGYMRCRVTRLAPPPDPVVDPGQSFAANIQTPIGLGTALTLRGLVEKQIARRAGVALDGLRITFGQRDTKELDLPILGRSVEVEPVSLNTLGRVPMVVRLYESGRVAQTIHVGARVERRMLAVVVTEPIQRGDYFTRGKLEVREVFIDDAGTSPITDPALIVGQVAAASIRPGELIPARLVKAPIMVKRGELVTVRCVVGGLVIRTIGRARENGSIDDVITVQNQQTGEPFFATVTGRHEAMVRVHRDRAAEPGLEHADAMTAPGPQGVTP